METIKINKLEEVPEDYTGIIEWTNKDKWWLKNKKVHREDGPAIIWYEGDEFWYLDGFPIWDNRLGLINLRDKIILSKERHSMYPAAQVWKYIDINGIVERLIIPGMEKFIKE